MAREVDRLSDLRGYPQEIQVPNIETIVYIQTGTSGEEVDTGCEVKDAHDQYLDATFRPQPSGLNRHPLERP